MRVSWVPVQQGFGETSRTESSFPFEARKSEPESANEEYTPRFADSPDTARVTQAEPAPAASAAASFQSPAKQQSAAGKRFHANRRNSSE